MSSLEERADRRGTAQQSFLSHYWAEGNRDESQRSCHDIYVCGGANKAEPPHGEVEDPGAERVDADEPEGVGFMLACVCELLFPLLNGAIELLQYLFKVALVLNEWSSNVSDSN
jgi:hypothetical protein